MTTHLGYKRLKNWGRRLIRPQQLTISTTFWPSCIKQHNLKDNRKLKWPNLILCKIKWWVTGASSGLGKALAGEFALQGAQVILTSRRFEELEEVRVGLLHPDQHLSVVADITNQSKFKRLMSRFLKQKDELTGLLIMRV